MIVRLLNLQQYYILNQEFEERMWQLEQEHYKKCGDLFRDW
jgi:hypothetical protein